MVLQLDLSNNKLCGINDDGEGTYNAEGITAIADALRVNGGLTKMSLAENKLGEEGTMNKLDLRIKGLRGPAAILISYLIPALTQVLTF